jgi:hypothetical protein|tara:strand:+ start:145 stop:498 length:354 start_codon:yes stop_codon:yes gene_type:complete
MKLSKEFLRKLIKEEKAKLVRESITDMRSYEDMFEQSALTVSDKFYDDMMKLYDEEPEAFARPDPNGSGMIRDSKDDWEQQVVYAQQEIDTGIAEAMRKVLQRIEMDLHDGQYFDGR